jgi:hypothetical protein
MTLIRPGLIALFALAWLDAARAQEQAPPTSEEPLSEAPLDEAPLNEDDLDALFRELEEDVAPAEVAPLEPAPDVVADEPLDPPEEQFEEDTGLGVDSGTIEAVEPERRQAIRLRPGTRTEDDGAAEEATTDAEATDDGETVDGKTREEDAASEDAASEDGGKPSDVMIPREAFIQQPGAELRALDKITGRYVDLSVENGQPVIFGTLEVTVETCFDTPPELPREASAFVKVKSLRPIAPESMPEEVVERLEGLDEDDPRVAEPVVFSGWMYASSPGLNAMEHPVYDIWVMSCSAS